MTTEYEARLADAMAQPINSHNDGSGYWFRVNQRRDGTFIGRVMGDDDSIIETLRGPFATRADAAAAAIHAIRQHRNAL